MDTVNIATFILDDDQDLLDIIRIQIVKAGITNYRLFSNGKDFLRNLSDRIHVCVLDYGLPGLNGYEVMQEIKKRNEYSFIIVYTVADDKDLLIKFWNAGADKFVNKNTDDHVDKLTIFLKEGLEKGRGRVEFAEYMKQKTENLTYNERSSSV